MSSLLDIARGALLPPEAPCDISDISPEPVAEIASDPNASIRAGLLAGDLAGWHIVDGIEVEGLAPWHVDALGVPTYDNPSV